MSSDADDQNAGDGQKIPKVGPADMGDSTFSAAPTPELDETERKTREVRETAGAAGRADTILDARIQQLEQELEATKDKLLRAVAEVQNMRKRAERDRRDAETYGGTKLARDLLPVYDNLETAIEQASDDLRDREAGFFNGVDLTKKELVSVFAKHKIKLIKPEIGEKFDHNEHQAMFEAAVPGAEPGTVIQVMQAGFMIAERLLRPAMVGVARAAADGESSSAA